MRDGMDGFNVDTLLARLDDLRTATEARFSDQNRVSTERHQENVQRLQRIEEEVRRTNGRVTRNEMQIEAINDRGSGHSNGESAEEVTLARLKWYLVCVGGGAAAMVWLLKMIGKL